MPLVNSGDALFAGSAAEFIYMAPAGRLTTHLEREFRARNGRPVGTSEQLSWQNSLTALANVTEAAGLDSSGVGVELKLPWNSKRIDASFVARDEKAQPHVVLVELKQWADAAASRVPEMVVVGGQQKLHPSVQVALYAEHLRESHSAFTEQDYRLSACSYVHNMSATVVAGLRGPSFEDALRDAPMFGGDDDESLAAFLKTSLCGGDGMALLPNLVAGRYSPSKKLLDNIARALTGSPVWTLLDEQREAFNVVRDLAQRAVDTGEKGVVIVSGGPGTGKSVIAAHLIASLSSGGQYKVAHATGSKAFTTNLRAVAGRGSSAVFRYFNNFPHKVTAEDALDVLICDEAHRIRETSNAQYTPRAKKSEIPQVQELIRAARVSVFLLDERQNVRPGEIGTVAAIEAGAAVEGVPVERIALDSQFRCNGSSGYIDWVNSLFTAAPLGAGAWRRAGEYDLEVFDSPAELEAAVLAQAERGSTARVVAGFCWPWSDPQADGTLEPDVVIGDWRRPWNEKSPEQTKLGGSEPPPGRHPYYLWATQPKGLNEIGCIYSAQGFEFDYCGVILGDDLVWREGQGWVANRASSSDSAIFRRRHGPGALEALLAHTYRVLMTRGMRGTFVYSTDLETRAKLRSLTATLDD